MVFLFVRVWLLCCGVVVVFLVLGFFFLGFRNWFWIVWVGSAVGHGGGDDRGI